MIFINKKAKVARNILNKKVLFVGIFVSITAFLILRFLLLQKEKAGYHIITY